MSSGVGGGGPLGDVPCFGDHPRPAFASAPIFTFVTDGIESALAKAREAAGEKRIGVMGANVPQQLLAAGLVDEIRVHLVEQRSILRRRPEFALAVACL